MTKKPLYVYDAMSNLAAEYGDSTTNSECITCYLTADLLRSTRLITDENGVAEARLRLRVSSLSEVVHRSCSGN